jgi:hypothetical protein
MQPRHRVHPDSHQQLHSLRDTDRDNVRHSDAYYLSDADSDGDSERHRDGGARQPDPSPGES